MRGQLADRFANRRLLVAGRLDPFALELPDVRRVELDDPVDVRVRGGGADRLDEPLLLVGEEILAVEHVRVPEDVGVEDGGLL